MSKVITQVSDRASNCPKVSVITLHWTDRMLMAAGIKDNEMIDSVPQCELRVRQSENGIRLLLPDAPLNSAGEPLFPSSCPQRLVCLP